jgi:hypothetical protein
MQCPNMSRPEVRSKNRTNQKHLTRHIACGIIPAVNVLGSEVLYYVV